MPAVPSLLRRIGPGLITVCVVVGPGSLLTSSKIGAQFGYEMLWVLAIAVILMLVYLTLGAKLGVMADADPGELLRRRWGAGLPLLIGIGVFTIAATFQFANNLGVLAALEGWYDRPPGSPWVAAQRQVIHFGLLGLLNLAAVVFLLATPKLYPPLEKIMTGFVGLMLVAFLINLCVAGPQWSELLWGLIPRVSLATTSWDDWVLVIGWIGTTFSTAIAYFQAYLVRQKGWTPADYRSGLLDVRVCAMLLGLITLMITATAATALRGLSLDSVGAVATQLEPTFGLWGKRLFCVGLFSAAYSSFLVNSSIGGFLLADGLRLGTHTEDPWPRRFAAVVLIIGYVVSLYVVSTGQNIVTAVVLAQALTVVVSPLLGFVLLLLTCSQRILGEHRNGWFLNLLAGLGLAMLLGLSAYVVWFKIRPVVIDWF